MDARVPTTVALALVLVVAGCGSPATTGTPTATPDGATQTAAQTATQTATPTSPAATRTATPTDTPTPTPDAEVGAWSKVDVQGGNFSFDAAAVYRRVLDLYDIPLSEAPDVTVYVRDTSSVSLSQIYRPSDFERAMGLTPETGETAIAGLARGTNVYIYTGVVTTADEQEATLAHEYAHVVQAALRSRTTLQRNVVGPETQRGRVTTGITEGAATFVENRYRVEYLGQQPGRLDWNESRAGRTAFGAFLVAPYVFGHRYVFRRFDSVENLSSVYEDPPQTTEQVIHNEDPDAEPPRPLSVRVSADETDWSVATRTTKGELFVRLTLERQLAAGRAATAAAGWGNDRAITLSDGASGRSFVWSVRWDSAAEADEFAAALRDYLDARGNRTDGVWDAGRTTFRVVRPSEETVVLLAGGESFVRDAAVSGSDGSVAVTVDGNATLVGPRVGVAPAAGPVPS